MERKGSCLHVFVKVKVTGGGIIPERGRKGLKLSLESNEKQQSLKEEVRKPLMYTKGCERVGRRGRRT